MTDNGRQNGVIVAAAARSTWRRVSSEASCGPGGFFTHCGRRRLARRRGLRRLPVGSPGCPGHAVSGELVLTSLFGDLGPGKDPDGKKASSADGEAPVAFEATAIMETVATEVNDRGQMVDRH